MDAEHIIVTRDGSLDTAYTRALRAEQHKDTLKHVGQLLGHATWLILAYLVKSLARWLFMIYTAMYDWINETNYQAELNLYHHN